MLKIQFKKTNEKICFICLFENYYFLCTQYPVIMKYYYDILLLCSQIKIIRTLTVIAYLISVSAVATILSAYYIFVWDPQTGNYTQTSNVEGVSMAFRIAEHERLTGKNNEKNTINWSKIVILTIIIPILVPYLR